MILIGAFGLFWFGKSVFGEAAECPWRRVRHKESNGWGLAFVSAFLVACRAFWQRRSTDGELGISGLPAPRRQAGFTGNNRGKYKSWPCSRYDVDCVVEEWSYY